MREALTVESGKQVRMIMLILRTGCTAQAGGIHPNEADPVIESHATVRLQCALSCSRDCHQRQAEVVQTDIQCEGHAEANYGHLGPHATKQASLSWQNAAGLSRSSMRLSWKLVAEGGAHSLVDFNCFT